MQFIRVTIIGGVVFMVPLAVLVIILGKVVAFLSRLAKPLAAWVPLDTVAGVALADIIAALGIIVLCFLAGLAARSSVVKNFVNSLESRFLYSIPGYSFVKSLTGSVTGVEDEKSLVPVMAKFDDAAQIAFQVEALPTGQVVVYIPGAPDPWAGALLVMDAERITPLNRSLQEAVRNLRGLGTGSAAFLGNSRNN
jgi:uncharacterized membrane protein